MDDLKRKEMGASEVIGAVLLVALVVVGGTVAAAFVFGQPTPKEVPHVSFGVYLKDEVLTLHHTGGDSLLPGEYGVTWYDRNSTPHPADPDETSVTWSSNGDLPIHDVNMNVGDVGDVVLTYRDGSGGETVLRRVRFEDFGQATVDNPPGSTPPSVPWTISGHKWIVNSTGYRIEPLKDVVITLTKTEGDFAFPPEGNTTSTNETGYYEFEVPPFRGTYSLAETIDPIFWRPYSPSNGRIDGIKPRPYRSSIIDQDFYNERMPTKISGYKNNVTWKGAFLGPVADITIRLTKTQGNVDFPSQGRTTTTNNTGYYEFEVLDEVSTYRLAEEGVDWSVWRAHDPVTGAFAPSSSVIENVAPGAENQNFSNEKLVPNKKISGHKWWYFTPGWLYDLDPPTIQIDLTLTSGDIPDMLVGQTNITRTDKKTGYYEFVVSGYPANYTVKETNLPAEWTPWSPSTGSWENVMPGSTRDFKNKHVPKPPMGGRVIRLDKVEQIVTTTEGYVVGGTYLQVDVKGGDHVTFGTNTPYTFPNNNEVFRFVLNGDQNRGRLTITKGPTELVEFSFNATLQHQVNGVWTAVPGCSGPITDIHITNLNKNTATAGSTLTYRQPPYRSDTMLRLDGRPVITSPPEPPNSTPFEFSNLHIVHDNSEHEGNNIMFIYLEPGLNSLLVEGDYVYV